MQDLPPDVARPLIVLVERAAQSSLTDTDASYFIADVRRAVAAYNRPRPTPTKEREDLQDIAEEAENLVSRISELLHGHPNFARIDAAATERHPKRSPQTFRRLQEVQSQLIDLTGWCDAARGELGPTPKRRPPDTRMGALVIDLIEPWERFTGTRASTSGPKGSGDRTGRFVEFVRVVLRVADPAAERRRQRLGETVEDALQIFREVERQADTAQRWGG